MTEIEVKEFALGAGTYYSIEAHGHAGAAPKGQDIVCAAVSVLMQTLADAVEEMAREGQLETGCVSYADAELRVEAMPKPAYAETLAVLYSFAALGLDALAAQQPDHVRIAHYNEYPFPKEKQEAQEMQQQNAEANSLQMFAEGTGEAATQAAAAENGAASAGANNTANNTGHGTEGLSAAQKRQAVRSGTPKGEANPLRDVTYGKQPEETPAQKNRRERSELEQRLRGRVQSIHAAWNRQAEAVKAKYPDFDYAEASANPAFGDLMKRGVDLETAYKAVYFDRLMGANQAATAQAVERGVTQRIAARNTRPLENGTRPGGAAAMKTDVNSLTRADREEIERRVLHGARISF
jgi:uncharacterized protein YsxB (DUF464 family)